MLQRKPGGTVGSRRTSPALCKRTWSERILVPAVGEALGLIRKQLREEFAAEIASLRTDVTVQATGRGEIAQIKGKADAP